MIEDEVNVTKWAWDEVKIAYCNGTKNRGRNEWSPNEQNSSLFIFIECINDFIFFSTLHQIAVWAISFIMTTMRNNALFWFNRTIRLGKYSQRYLRWTTYTTNINFMRYLKTISFTLISVFLLFRFCMCVNERVILYIIWYLCM